MRFAHNAVATPPSGIREVVHAVIESQRDVLRLEIGEAPFNSPPHVIEAAHQAALAGHTRYTSSTGIADLKLEICKKLARVNDLNASPENIAVVTGAIEGIFLALASLCEPGDEILVPDPGWPNYEMIATLIGARCRPYPCTVEDGCIPSPDAIEATIGERTRALIVNSPNNPTGAVYPPDVIERLVEIARERGITLISDETYDELYFEQAPVSALQFGGVEGGNVVSVFSFSKTYAMTGWRVGYVVGPATLTSMVGKLQEPVNSCVSSISQHAALAALRGSQEWVEQQRAAFRGARDAAVRALERERCGFVKPQGSFYLWLQVDDSDSVRFMYGLLAEENIAVAPGSAFGASGDGFVRVCLAPLGEDAESVLTRIAHHMRRPANQIVLSGNGGNE